jgi:multiple sugar transport system ATP-binding protein
MAEVSLRGLEKRYGSTVAVGGVSLDVADGELLVLLGASGSGKSTILKLIAGIEAPDGGEVWIDGRRVDPLLPRYRDVAMVFQSYALYPQMTVSANLGFPLGSVGVGRDEIRRRVAEVAALLELEGLLDRRPAQLSGGQQQRVALGRAIIRRPKLFLMDEPLSNLDARLRARTRGELRALHERLAATTIYVTHDQVEALTMGQRVAVLHEGVLHQVGPPEEVYEHPADLVVAEILGSPAMNLLRVAAGVRDGRLVLSTDGVSLSLPLAAVDLSEVVLGVRPEYLRLGGDEPAGHRFEAVVARAELLGSERVVHVRAGPAQLALKVPSSVRPSPGDPVTVTVDPAGVRLFDPVTGRTLPLRSAW